MIFHHDHDVSAVVLVTWTLILLGSLIFVVVFAATTPRDGVAISWRVKRKKKT